MKVSHTAPSAWPFARMVRAMLIVGAMLGLMVAGSQAAGAQAQGPFVGLTEGNEIITFDPANPSQVDARVAVGGDAAGDTIIGMDYRPETNELFAAGASSNLYVLDPATGAATAQGTIDPAIEGSVIGFDFNPTADAIRIVTDTGQNLRLADLDEGFETNVDEPLAYDEGDANAGVQPAAVAAGYTNNVPDAEDTMLFDLDLATGSLVQQEANEGVLTTIGPLGVPFTAYAGFDIAAPNDDAFVVLQPGEGLASSLYSIDLGSGAASEIGAIGGGEVLRDFAIPTGGAPAMGAMDDGVAAQPLPDTGGFSSLAVVGAALAAFAIAGGAFALRTVRRDA